MGNLLTFLIIGAVIVISVYRNLTKKPEGQEKQPTGRPQKPGERTFDKRRTQQVGPSQRTMPSNRQTPPPIPRSLSTNSYPSPSAIDSVESYLESQKASSKPKETISVTASLAKSAEQDAANVSLNKQAARVEGENEANDYIIDSVEEARKAIIWGELLQRKY